MTGLRAPAIHQIASRRLLLSPRPSTPRFSSCTRAWTFQSCPSRHPASSPRPARAAPRETPARWYSAPSGSELNKAYEYKDIKELVDRPSEDRILIDVREPAEYAAGAIPTAVNVPISSQPDALFLPPEEFEDRFGFEKPGHDKEVVFYCKAGVRSAAAAVMARESGYGQVGEYRGSWMDWVKKKGQGG